MTNDIPRNAIIGWYIQEGWLTFDGDKYSLTEKGLKLAKETLIEDMDGKPIAADGDIEKWALERILGESQNEGTE